MKMKSKKKLARKHVPPLPTKDEKALWEIMYKANLLLAIVKNELRKESKWPTTTFQQT